MNNAQEVSSKIVQIISESPDQSILGVRLGASLRTVCPNFRPHLHRCRNLRQFISHYVPDIAEAGRAGMDIVYRLKTEKTASATPLTSSYLERSPITSTPFVPLPTSAEVWKAYTNPSYPFIVISNQETGETRAVAEGSFPTAPWVVLSKPTSGDHAEIARKFVSTLSEPYKTKLNAVLLDSKWYVQFSTFATKNGLGQQWVAFRRKTLIERFNSALQDAKISSTSRNTETIAEAARRELTVSQNDETKFRELVSRVVSQLSIAELRALKLPVGIVFDVLKN